MTSIQQDREVGSLCFNKRPEKELHYGDKKPFIVPESYNTNSLEHAYNHLSTGKKVKGQVNIDSMTQRDNSMYPVNYEEFNNVQMKIYNMLQLQSSQNKQSSHKKASQSMNMTDYIPNSLCKNGALGSTISLYSTNIESNEVVI